MSRTQEVLEEFKRNGGVHPECVNIGCDRPAAIRDVKGTGSVSFHNMCSRCKRQHEQNLPFDEGIMAVRKNQCDNSNGGVRGGAQRNIIQPGWGCPVANLDLPSYQLILDHIDGNHTNNSPENLQTLCKFCDSEKSHRMGDWGN